MKATAAVLPGVLLTIVLAAPVAEAQTPKSASTKTSANADVDKYKEAKNLIRRARTLLSDFLQDQPGGEDAHFARLQLRALENIFKTDVPVVPVKLDDAIVWRVLRVETTDAHTKVTLEIENSSPSDVQYFYHFNARPLVMLANKKVYAMKTTPIKRPSVVTARSDETWNLEPTQAIALDLYFDALDEGVTEGMIKYATGTRSTPAGFSLVNTNQNPVQE